MRSRHVLIAIALLVMLVTAGCTNLLFGIKPGFIQGRVVLDGAAPGPVQVEIAAVGTSFKTQADADGNFKLQLPSPEKYTLQVTGDGVVGQSISVSLGRGQTLTGIEIEATYLPSTPLALDFDNPAHVGLIEKPYPGLLFSIEEDRFGQTAMLFPPGTDDQRPPEGYNVMRWALLKYPEVDEFELSLEQIGVGGEQPSNPKANGGNRSLSLIFGYEDLNNWWFAYFAYTNSTRIGRVVNGKAVNICEPKVADVWIADNEAYQSAKIRLTTEGADKVLRVEVNGAPAPTDGCVLPADYKPGKVGFGGFSNSAAQSWFFRNISFDIL